jgi:hypothetical protein
MSSAHEQIEIAGPTPQPVYRGTATTAPFWSMAWGIAASRSPAGGVPKLLRDIPTGSKIRRWTNSSQVPPVTR